MFVSLASGQQQQQQQQSQQQQQRPPRPPRPGVKEPGVQRPMSVITPTAVFPIEGVPDWQVITEDSVWVSNGPKNTLHRLDPKTNTIAATIEAGMRPCSGLAAGFGSIWVPNCGDNSLTRVDIATNKKVANLPYGPAASEGGLATNSDSVWILSDRAGILSRIDPVTNQRTAAIQVPSGSYAAVLGEDGAIWISSTENSVLARVDPKTNSVTDTIPVGPQPRFLTAGGGSIWTLNQGDGTVSRVDVKTKKLVTNIQLGVPGTGGEIHYGEGYVWVTVFEIPLTQIDPATNKVVRQWVGLGGDAVRAGFGSVWLSNLRQQNMWRIHPNQLAAGVAVGTLPKTWQTGGPNCEAVPKWQVHEYNPNFYILRESGCTHYEKPFLYLIFGAERALLEDTGAGQVDTASVVMEVIAQWAKRNNKTSVPLVVVHSHAHGDHTAGDAQFKDKADVQFVAASPAEIQKAFGIQRWPEDVGQMDLGGRVLDVIPIPGHNVASIALYDRTTGILLTGDSFYPGRLYVADAGEFIASNQRLVDFTRDRPVSHILGAHIEQMRTPYMDYVRGTAYQPDEHALELSRGDLLELNEALQRWSVKSDKIVLKNMTVVPLPAR
jgi:glyoxylase-like metal-dependent hydrolase (beta-lactamase superfamily II)/streptogramin lyase